MEAVRLEPRDFVAARLYASEDDVVQEALRHLLEARPDLRIPVAVELYRRDKRWSIAGAAQLAGVTYWEMIEILEAHGVEPRLGPATVEEARAELTALKRRRDASTD